MTVNNNKRILLVDDEPDITFSFGIGLKDNGFKVDTFNNPLEAISNFKSDFYDLVVLDIKMPEMNGIDLCKEIRKIDSEIKVCFLTAFDSRYGELKQCSECFIRKPITIDGLVEKVKSELDLE
jgi:DNA-binding response OmpR family regulator